MNKILVTGATGHLGRLTIDELLKRVPAGNIAALVRDPDKAVDLAQNGIDVRKGDYQDKASLSTALAGIDKVLLVSAAAFSDRVTQHQNVIDAAKAAGVRHIIYTSIQRKAGSCFEITSITASDIATEAALKASGLHYTILHNALYIDVLPAILGPDVLDVGVRVPGAGGSSPMVARADLAEANAVILTSAGHENRSYTLGASQAFSFADAAEALSAQAGQPVPYFDVSTKEFLDARVANGMPGPVATFLVEWVKAVADGEFAEVTGDLERLIGRTPLGYEEFFAGLHTKEPLI